MILRTDKIYKYYNKKPVVNGVSIELNQGEIVGLLGPNGAGKTTTFYSIVGLIKSNRGAVFLNDLNITSQPMYKRAQMGIGYLPQEASVFRSMSVEDNIKSVLEMTKLTKDQQDKKDDQDKNQDQEKDPKDNQNPEDKKGDEQEDKKEPQEPKDPKDEQAKQQQQQPADGQLSPQQVKNLLESMNNQEKKVQDKINAKKQKGVKIKSEKDW